MEISNVCGDNNNNNITHTSWPCSCTPGKCTLHNEITEFCKWISPTKEETMMRESVIVRISCVVYTLWPSARVKTYGSYATQLYLPNSDIDLCVLGAPPGDQTLCNLADALREKDLSTSLQVIANARVPVVKLTDKVSGAVVDISINHDIRTNQLVADYTSRYPELRPLTLVLKYFLYQRKLHECYNGGLSSYSLIVVIISFLQFHVQPMIASNGCVSSKASLDIGDLLIKFFKFYGVTFDYERMGISITNNGSFFPKSSRNWYDPSHPCRLSIESPFEPDTDLGRGMFAAAQVRSAFEDAHNRLTENRRLGSVITIDPCVVQRRQQIIALYTRTPTPVSTASNLTFLSNPIITTQCLLPSPPHLSPKSSRRSVTSPRVQSRGRTNRQRELQKHRNNKKTRSSVSPSTLTAVPPKEVRHPINSKDGTLSFCISSNASIHDPHIHNNHHPNDSTFFKRVLSMKPRS